MMKYQSLNWKNEKLSTNLMLFGSYLKGSSDLFECFPGGKQGLIKIVAEKTNRHSLPTNILTAIEFIAKNNLLSKDQLVNWRNELNKIIVSKNDKETLNVIGMLTLSAGEIKHIACVPDGNRRWASNHGLPITKAHDHAFLTSIPNLVENTFKYGVHTFSIWLFQEKNLLRSKEEVIESILKNLIKMSDVYLEMARRLNIRIYHIGNKICPNQDPDIKLYFNRLMDVFDTIENETKHFTKHHLIIGANYEREDDLLRAIKKIQSQNINPSDLKPKDIIKFTDMGKQPYPYPDLYIRSAMPYGGGRVGGFLPTTSDACVYFTPILAPELTINEVIAGAAIFANPLFRYKSAEQPIEKDKGLSRFLSSKL